MPDKGYHFKTRGGQAGQEGCVYIIDDVSWGTFLLYLLGHLRGKCPTSVCLASWDWTGEALFGSNGTEATMPPPPPGPRPFQADLACFDGLLLSVLAFGISLWSSSRCYSLIYDSF